MCFIEVIIILYHNHSCQSISSCWGNWANKQLDCKNAVKCSYLGLGCFHFPFYCCCTVYLIYTEHRVYFSLLFTSKSQSPLRTRGRCSAPPDHLICPPPGDVISDAEAKLQPGNRQTELATAVCAVLTRLERQLGRGHVWLLSEKLRLLTDQ